MTLDAFRPIANRTLDPFVRMATRIGATPDAISIIAIVCSILAGFAFWLAGAEPIWYLIGAVLVFFNGWFDLLDGAVAREQGIASPAGDLLDHVLDRYADIVIVVGLAAGIDDYFLGLLAITGVLMTSYLGTQAIAVGMDRVYGGIVGRADRLALIGITGILVYLFPGTISGLTLVGWLLVILAIVGHFTALQRFYISYRTLT